MAKVLRDGIILAREAARGGPRRLLICPSCLKENLCEETGKGRWFASPNVTLSILDILFSQLPGGATEEVLQAISWYRENEERRRRFFNRDGDRRYEDRRFSFLHRLWPWSGGPSQTPPEPGRAAGSQASSGNGGSSRSGPKRGPEATGQRGPQAGEGSAGGPRRPPPRPPRPTVVTPYEVLGLPPQASIEEVRRAFHRLAVQYHPDKVHHLGEAFQAMAHVKFQELLRAYDSLMNRDGPSLRKR